MSAIKLDKLPEKVILPLKQHDGIACAPLVKKGEEVVIGQKIGDCEGSDLAYIHSPYCGTVESVVEMPNPSGKRVLSVIINPLECADSVDFIPEKDATPSRLLEIIKEAGIVEYYQKPTYLALKPGKRIDTLIMNATFPLITNAYLDSLDKVLKGFRLMLEAGGISRGAIVIRADDKESIKAFKNAKVDGKPLTVAPIIGKRHADYYFEDSEDEIIVLAGGKITYTPTMMNLLSGDVMGRKIPLGYEPADVHVAVCGVKSAKAVYDAVYEGKPYLENVITVSGAVNRPGSVLVKFGTPIKDVIEACGGYKGEPGKVIINGTRVGVAIYSDESPVAKDTTGIVVQTKDEVLRDVSSACIHCARCVDVCPMNLLPGRIAVMADQGMYEKCGEYYALSCIECGDCAAVCPAKKHLVQLIRFSKLQLLKMCAEAEPAEVTE